MCLLVSQPVSTKFDDDFIRGVYRLNSDGLGVMYAENNTLFINRIVPANEEDFVTFFHKHITGRHCAWHARMKTHGDIDLTNCHPYQVLSAEEGYPIWLAHNGVLATGNAADKSKSDTWHYIQDYLRPMLLNNPQFFLTKAFEEIVGDHIGSGNKFILMDAYDNIVTVNAHVGVQHEGAWLSNTYAWDTTGTVHDRPLYAGFGGSFGGYGYSSRFPGLHGKAAWEDAEDEEAEVTKGSKEETRAQVSDDEYDDMLDFAGELFALAEEKGMDTSDMTWQNAEDYYYAVGHAQAWGLVEAVIVNAYTRDELAEELSYYSTPEMSVDEELIQAH